MKTPGRFKIDLVYSLGSVIEVVSSDKFKAIMEGCKSGKCGGQDPGARALSIDARFNFGHENFGKSGGEFNLYSKILDKNLLSLNNIDLILGENTTISYDIDNAGYPVTIDTGLFRTEFTYERETVNDLTYVKKITANYYQKDSNDLISYTTMQLNYEDIENITSFDLIYVNFKDGSPVTRTWTFKQTNQICPDLGIQKDFWYLKDGDKDEYLTYDTVGDLKTSYRYTGSVENPTTKVVKTEKNYPWGYKVISETIANKTTTYDYYTETFGGKEGLLKKITYPKGNTIEYFYDNKGRIIRTVKTIGDAIKEIVKTFDGNKVTTISKYNGQIIAKSESVNNYGDFSKPDIYKRFDENDNVISSSTTYKINNSSSDYHGRVRLTKNSDGTAVIKEYEKNEYEEIVRTYSGVLDMDDEILNGVMSISKSNIQGQTTYSASWDIESNTKLSETTALEFDEFGRVTKTQYMDGTTSEKRYGCCGVEWEKDRDGIETTYAYDSQERLSYSIRDGITTLYTYDDAGNQTAVTVKGKNDTEITTSSAYINGELTSTTDAMNRITQYEYNADNDKVIFADGTTQQTNYTLGQMTSVSGTAVHGQSYSYGPNWQKQNETNVTSYTDMLGRNYKTVYADGTFSETFYNAKGQAWKQVSPAGRVTLLEYDDLGRNVRQAVDMNKNDVIDGNDMVTETVYSYSTRDGKAVQKAQSYVKNGDGSNSKLVSITEQAIDGSQSWSTAEGLTSTTSIVRDGAGTVTTTSVSPDGSKSVTVTVNGLTQTVTNTPGNTVLYTYDEFNRVSTVTEKHGETVVNTISYVYNDNSEVVSVTSNGQTVSYEYDNRGRRVKVTNPGNRVVNYTFYPTGELNTVDGADTYRQEYSYNDLGQMATLKTFKDLNTPQTTSFEYNNRGQLAKKTYNDGKFTSYEYNADGQMSKRIWHRGVETSYNYDNAGRQTTIDYSDATADISFDYDWMGRVTSVIDATGTHAINYNANNTVASVTVPHLLNTVFNYSYDNLMRRTNLTLSKDASNVLTNNYTYDNFNQLATLSDGVNTATYMRKPSTRQLSSITITKDVNGVPTTMMTQTKTYDNLHRMKKISNVATSVNSSMEYDYNDKNQRVKATLADGTAWVYTYDEKGQLINANKFDTSAVAIPNHFYGYEYDLIGNRLTAKKETDTNIFNYTANNLNQYQSVVNGATTESFTYDDDGNMLTNGNWLYTYNGENRMTTAESGTKRLEYTYDYQGRRVEKKEFDNSTLIKHTKFVYDGNNVVAEYEDNALSKKYLWGEDVSGSMAGAGGVGALLVVNDTTEDYYSMYDGNGNIVKYVDETSNEVASFEYTPFGTIKSASGSMVDELHYRFSTKYFDNSTNLIVYRYRNYNPTLGKWQTRDPLGEFTEQNNFNLLYGFVTNIPVSYVDYLGLSEFMKYQYEQVYGTPYVATDPDISNISAVRHTLKFEIDGSEEERKILPKNTILLDTSKAWADFKNRIEKLFAKRSYDEKCHCIEYLVLIQHGIGKTTFENKDKDSYGTLFLFDETLVRYARKWNPKTRTYERYIKNRAQFLAQDTKKYLNFIAKYLCKDEATVEFMQCAAGRGSEGKMLHDDLKSVLGENTKVILYTTNVTPIKYFGLIDGIKGTRRK